MFRNKSVNVHDFAMIPRADIPRSSFRIQKTHKSTFDSGYLVPVWVDEVLPGDSFNLSMTAFARMATPIFPFMDNLFLDSFFFFVPNRLVWDNWVKFMGEQVDPGDSIDYIVPQVLSPADGYAVGSLQDHMGLPTVGQLVAGGIIAHNSLFLRAYNLIFNEWFRDENLQDSLPVPRTDGGDVYTDYNMVRRGKRHDYFTSCLPFLQKGTAVPLPLGTTAPVYTTAATNADLYLQNGLGGTNRRGMIGDAVINVQADAATAGLPNIFTDLSAATAATINQIRQSFQIQKLLERDARGGTRYTEIMRSHFGVISPDARMQRPEYLGGGSTPIQVNPVANTTDSGTAPQGTLAAFAQGIARSGFHYSATEHGMIIGMVSVRADLTYQQGIRKMWDRRTRYDFYFPVFAMLGEQAVLNREIYVQALAVDNEVFGYQERWAEYRYNPSMICGLFKSTAAGTLDQWHLSQRFTALPTLNTTFIQDTPPVERVVAVPSEPEFLFDAFFDVRAARPLPMYSPPGMVDHF